MMEILLPDTGLVRALAVLREGGVVVHATETCYGIACDLTNPVAVQKLFAVKNRPPDQPVSALFPSIEFAGEYVEIAPKAVRLAAEHLPGPLTLVLPRRSNAPDLWVTVSGGGRDPMIGIRVSSHSFAAALSRRFGKPIATTSANLHGLSNPYSPEEVSRQFAGHMPEPDLLISEGERPVAPPSTVVAVIGDEVRILRQGVLAV